MNDRLGQPISVGSVIAYAVMDGYSPIIRIGKVCQVSEKPHEWREGVIESRITVHGIDVRGGTAQLLSKKGTLQFPDRVIVLRDDQLDETTRALLQGV